MVKRRNKKILERNEKILKLWDGGSYKILSIARMFKMGESAVSMVIHRDYKAWKEKQAQTQTA